MICIWNFYLINELLFFPKRKSKIECCFVVVFKSIEQCGEYCTVLYQSDYICFGR